ncbi:hypothetical protein ACHAWF_011489, partial [Thalassiosira exigua]
AHRSNTPDDPVYSSLSSPSPPSAATRPYTSYNLFFQLEREYVIQTVHGYRPQVDQKDRFDPTDKTNYDGSPLPPRYCALVLLNDWHIPGKTRRRKRLHRKSHGNIGFHQMNGEISRARSVVDEETRSFCDRLSAIESKK